MEPIEKQKEFDELVYQLSIQVHKHTIQFLAECSEFRYNPHGYRYKPYGSGVLIFADKKCLIITAAHVTADFVNTPLFINSNKGIIRVEGEIVATDLDKDKTIDFAYIILNDAIAAILVHTYDFLPINKIRHSHIPEIANQYLVVGYPTENIRVDKKEKKVYTGSSAFLLTMSRDIVYDYYKFDKHKNYILDFAGKGIDLETFEKSGKISNPNGISGCGLWFLSEKSHSDTYQLQYLLIGIMIQFRKGKYHCLIGNRIELIMSALIDNEKFNIEPITTPIWGYASMLADE